MANIILTNCYIFLIATVLAILEIQIEGKNGWARNLPTWRGKPDKWYTKLYMVIMNNKELTGYHLAMFSLIFLIFHLPYFFGLPLNLENWLKTAVFILIFLALWDFLWFVLNPFYPIKDFAKNNVNHKKFFLGLPVEYYFAVGISLVLALMGEYLWGFSMVRWWVTNFVLFIIQILILIFFSLYILKIDSWHQKQE